MPFYPASVSLMLKAVFQKWQDTGVFVEQADPADIADVSEIHRDSFVRGWSDGEFDRMLGGGGYTLLVARRQRHGNRPVTGFVLARTVQDEAEIVSIATRKSNRQRGVGRALMQALIRHLSTERIKSCFLEVSEDNMPALALYKSLGFVKVGERKGYYSPGHRGEKPAVAALVMRLDLL